MPTGTTNLPQTESPSNANPNQTTGDNPSTDVTSNVTNLIDSVKNLDTTTLMMIGGSVIMLFIIFK